MKQTIYTLLRQGIASALVVGVIIMALPIGGNAAEVVTVQTSVQKALTFGVNSNTANLGNLTPSTPVWAYTELTVDTNGASGYNITSQFTTSNCSASDTLCHSDTTTPITDKTEFDGVGTCTATAAWSGTGLGFTVYTADTGKNTTCWGTGTAVNDAANLYAGFPTTDQIILNVTSGPKADDDTAVGYKCDVATTQKSGAYSGTVQYTATAN
jgi:hypothetical protein